MGLGGKAGSLVWEPFVLWLGVSLQHRGERARALGSVSRSYFWVLRIKGALIPPLSVHEPCSIRCPGMELTTSLSSAESLRVLATVTYSWHEHSRERVWSDGLCLLVGATGRCLSSSCWVQEQGKTRSCSCAGCLLTRWEPEAVGGCSEPSEGD